MKDIAMFLYPQLRPGIFNPLNSFYTQAAASAPAGYPNTGLYAPSAQMNPGARWGPFGQPRPLPSNLQLNITRPYRLPGPIGRPLPQRKPGFQQTHFMAPGYENYRLPGMYANQQLLRGW